MDKFTLLRRLDSDGSTGLDLSPGDPLCTAAAKRIRDLEAQLLSSEQALENRERNHDDTIRRFDIAMAGLRDVQSRLERGVWFEERSEIIDATINAIHAANDTEGGPTIYAGVAQQDMGLSEGRIVCRFENNADIAGNRKGVVERPLFKRTVEGSNPFPGSNFDTGSEQADKAHLLSKLAKWAAAPNGWAFGDGKAFHPQLVELVKTFVERNDEIGDLFPGRNGNIVATVYYADGSTVDIDFSLDDLPVGTEGKQ